MAIWLRAGARRVDTSDDAFISFRYAWNLVHGHGLTWNRHMDPVEGYSNLAWTLLAAVGIGVGAPVAWWAKVWGTALYAGSAVAAAGAVRRVGGSWTSAAMAVALCCASTIGARWAMAGLETPLLAFCLVAGTWAAIAEDQGVRAGGRPTPWSLALFGVASITHVEGPLYLGIPVAIRLLRWRVDPLGRRDLAHLALLCAPAAAQVALRLGYYGDVLPNTLRAKGLGGADPGRILGLRYLLAGLTYNVPQGLLFVVGGALALLAGRGALLLPGLCVAVFIVVADGDDFGDLRFFAPAIPSLIAAGVAGFDVLAARLARARAWITGVACAAVLAFELPPQSVQLAITPLQLRPLLEDPGAEVPSWTAGPWARVTRQPWSRILEGDGFVADTEVPWFFRFLLENLPVGASFYFEDVGRVGYALAHNDLLDGRGLNWRAAALLDKAGNGDARFQAEFLQAAPVVVSVSCGGGIQARPALSALIGSPAFQRDYVYIGEGPYFGDAGRVCLWARGDAVPPSWEIVEARYRRLLRDMPGDLDWATALQDAQGARARR